MPSSPWKWPSLALMLVQNAITPIVFRYATTGAREEDRFSTVVSIGCQEGLKLVMSLGLVILEHGGLRGTFKALLAIEFGDSIRLAVPALLFVFQNAAMQLATVHLPAALFQVLWQGKTLVMAGLSVMLLDKRLVRSAWLAIAVMAAGIAGVQLSQSKESKQASMANASEQRPALGFLFVLGGCFCSGFAAVYLEKLVKQTGRAVKTSMWVQNMQLAFYSLILTGLTTGASRGSPDAPLSDRQETHGIFHGFSFNVWVMIFNNAIGGLLVALVIKHADNILRGFSTALATVLTTILSVVCFGFEVHISFFFGGLLVVGSSLLYGGAVKIPGEWWNTDPFGPAVKYEPVPSKVIGLETSTREDSKEVDEPK
ncbi:SLC35A1 [Symbiodinium sp. KB8]|nr:SLC35A1 [Symbiodinium sp. KB8]